LRGNNHLNQRTSDNYYSAITDQIEVINLGNSNYHNRNNFLTADYQRSKSHGRDLNTEFQHHSPQGSIHYDNYYAPQLQRQQIYSYSDFREGQNYCMLTSPANFGGFSANGFGKEIGYGYTQVCPTTQYQRFSSGSLPHGPSFAGERKESTSFEHSEPHPGNLTKWPRPDRLGVTNDLATEFAEMSVTLLRQDTGFGFRIVGGTEEGSQVKKEKPT